MNASVVIPARDEAAVIGQLLRGLATAAGSHRVEVIVACNGCTDDTAEIARSFEGVKVIEIEQGSKAAALNAGDGAAHYFPRIYVDADVNVVPESLFAIVAAMNRDQSIMVAGPRAQHSFEGASLPIRLLYRAQRHSDYYGGAAYASSGVYALSEAGRKRFVDFPDVIADDTFVRNQFHPRERATIADAVSVVAAPRSVRAHIRRCVRVAAGNTQLRRLGMDREPGMVRARGRSRRYARFIARALTHPADWPGTVIYAFSYLAAHTLGAYRTRFGDMGRWDRDQTSRTAAGIVPAPASVVPGDDRSPLS